MDLEGLLPEKKRVGTGYYWLETTQLERLGKQSQKVWKTHAKGRH